MNDPAGTRAIPEDEAAGAPPDGSGDDGVGADGTAGTETSTPARGVDAAAGDGNVREFPRAPDAPPPAACGRPDGQGVCHACGARFGSDQVGLRQVMRGREDKAGNVILEVLWAANDFRVYRTVAGVHVHFSDCAREEAEQRRRYYPLYARVSEMRYLVGQMSPGFARFRRRPEAAAEAHTAASGASFYDRVTAEAIVQALAGRDGCAGEMLAFAHAIAAERVTNENRVRYLVACVAAAVLLGGGFAAAGAGLSWFQIPQPYALACVFGALGAVFSIATRVNASELAPCRQSAMNYVMGALRVATGAMGGGLLVLALTSGLVGDLPKVVTGVTSAASLPWERVAMLGLLAGFVERLVPSLVGRAADGMAGQGTGGPGAATPGGGGTKGGGRAKATG